MKLAGSTTNGLFGVAVIFLFNKMVEGLPAPRPQLQLPMLEGLMGSRSTRPPPMKSLLVSSDTELGHPFVLLSDAFQPVEEVMMNTVNDVASISSAANSVGSLVGQLTGRNSPLNALAGNGGNILGMLGGNSPLASLGSLLGGGGGGGGGTPASGNALASLASRFLSPNNNSPSGSDNGLGSLMSLASSFLGPPGNNV